MERIGPNLIRPRFYLIVIILSASQVMGAPQTLAEDYTKLTQRLLAKNSLDYKDSCSFYDERLRTEIGLKLLDMAFERNFTGFDGVMRDVSQLVDSSVEFCNVAKHLQCHSSGVCDCANGASMGLPLRTVREENECRLAAGTMCVPHEEATGTLSTSQNLNLKCQENSECIFRNSTQPCLEEIFHKKIMDAYGGIDRVIENQVGYSKHVKKMIWEGLCVCSGEEVAVDGNFEKEQVMNKSNLVVASIPALVLLIVVNFLSVN